jgi:antitoxin CptB
MTLADEPTDTRRRRLLWRATHRGIKEMDLLLGGFAKARIAAMSEADLCALDAVIDIPDQEMLSWATSQAEIPPEQDTPLLREILAFRP